jgi:hypothetical protein
MAGARNDGNHGDSGLAAEPNEKHCKGVQDRGGTMGELTVGHLMHIKHDG